MWLDVCNSNPRCPFYHGVQTLQPLEKRQISIFFIVFEPISCLFFVQLTIVLTVSPIELNRVGFLMASYLLSVWNTRLNPHETFSTLEEESLTWFRAVRPRDVAAKPLGHLLSLLSLRRETQHTWSTKGMLRATVRKNFTCFPKATAEKLDFNPIC